jgi:hypothetical protein
MPPAVQFLHNEVIKRGKLIRKFFPDMKAIQDIEPMQKDFPEVNQMKIFELMWTLCPEVKGIQVFDLMSLGRRFPGVVQTRFPVSIWDDQQKYVVIWLCMIFLDCSKQLTHLLHRPQFSPAFSGKAANGRLPKPSQKRRIAPGSQNLKSRKN